MPPDTLTGDPIKLAATGKPDSQFQESNHDPGNMHNAINFATRLQQFEHVKNQHRMHSRNHSRNWQFSRSASSATLSQEMQRSEGIQQSEVSRRPARSSWINPGQFQH